MLANFKKVSTSLVDDGVIDKKEFRAMMTDGAPSNDTTNSVFFDGLFRMFDRDSSGEIDFQVWPHDPLASCPRTPTFNLSQQSSCLVMGQGSRN